MAALGVLDVRACPCGIRFAFVLRSFLAADTPVGRPSGPLTRSSHSADRIISRAASFSTKSDSAIDPTTLRSARTSLHCGLSGQSFRRFVFRCRRSTSSLRCTTAIHGRCFGGILPPMPNLNPRQRTSGVQPSGNLSRGIHAPVRSAACCRPAAARRAIARRSRHPAFGNLFAASCRKFAIVRLHAAAGFFPAPRLAPVGRPPLWGIAPIGYGIHAFGVCCEHPSPRLAASLPSLRVAWCHRQRSLAVVPMPPCLPAATRV